jgi:hypothetical protein
MIEIVSQLVVTSPLKSGNGYTYTLTSLLGQMLRLAESRFGERDRSYTILGVEFIDGIPQHWFPGNCRNIVVQLSTQCLQEPDRACFQIAHETIHLLSPTGGQNANVLEEGLVSHFQTWYMSNHYPPDWPCTGFDWNRFDCQSYVEAKLLVEQLLGLDPDVIKHLRVKQPTLSLISAEAIEKACPKLMPEVAAALAARFKRG